MQSAWWNYPRVRTARSTVKGISVQCGCGACQSSSRYLNDVYPYAQQISNYIEREIFQQKLKAGQKLLSITNLSKELNVSKHTIQLSYKILRKKELIVKKGNDFFVTKDNCCIITKMKEETDLQIIKCLHELAEMGYSREQTKSLILRKLETLKFPQ